MRVLDGQGNELDQSLPLCEALRGEFMIDLGHAAIRPDGRAFSDYMKALQVEQAELTAERAHLDALHTTAVRRSAVRDLTARLGFGAFLYAQLGVIVYLTYDIGWDIMEPTTYLMGLFNAVLSYGVFLITHRDFSFEYHLERMLARAQARHAERLGYDPLRRDYVQRRLERLEHLLRLYDKRASATASLVGSGL